jgi:hypothetical protein
MCLIKKSKFTCMKKLFSRIQEHLCSTHEALPTGNALKRINSLSGFITGMIRKGKSTLPAIGSGIPKNINADSKTIAAKRFVENKWTDYDSHYLPFLAEFLRAFIAFTPAWEKLCLVVDGSQIGKDNAALMISLVWQNRGIPICWFVKKGSKGHFKEEDHVKVLEHAIKILLPLIPKDMDVILLGDGEFDGIDLQKTCLSQCWDYVLRTACSSVFYEDGERFQAKDIEPIENQNCAFISDIEFTEKRFTLDSFLCWYDKKKYDEPIFLVSSLHDAGDIMHYYDKRYSIECLFKDLKSTSFNLHKTRLKDPCDVSNLIIIAALAFIMVLTLGAQFNEIDWRKKIQRVRRGRKVLSIFSFAYILTQHLLDNDIDFNFSFQFSKNYDDFFPGYT